MTPLCYLSLMNMMNIQTVRRYLSLDKELIIRVLAMIVLYRSQHGFLSFIETEL